MPLALFEPWTGFGLPSSWFVRDLAPRSARMWGDGLCEQSLETTLYPATWTTVSDDELVFLLPSLMPSSRRVTVPDQPVARLADIISQHIHGHLGFALERLATCPKTTLHDMTPTRLVMASGVLASSLRAAMNASEPSRPMVWLRTAAPCTRAEAAHHLALLSALDQFYADALVLSRDGHARPLADVALVSITARVNGAYVYHEHAGSHDMLTACAWLGHLMTAPAAYLPVAVAESLADLLDEARADLDPCVALLASCADSVGGRARLQAAARRVAASGQPASVRRLCRRGWSMPMVWNAALKGPFEGHYAI